MPLMRLSLKRRSLWSSSSMSDLSMLEKDIYLSVLMLLASNDFLMTSRNRINCEEYLMAMNESVIMSAL